MQNEKHSERSSEPSDRADDTDLSGKRVALLVADGFEQSEMTEPRDALRRAGIEVDLVSPSADQVRGWKEDDWGDAFDVDVELSEADGDRYDALVLPGGVMNPDTLRTDEEALDFVRHFFRSGKVVAAICHGPWTLIDAGVAAGRTMTSYPSIRRDLENAGVRWEDSEVVVDQGLVTSRKPDDLPAFCSKLIEEIAEGEHAAQRVSA